MKISRRLHFTILFLLLLPVGIANSAELLHPVAGKPAAKDFKLFDLENNEYVLSSYRGKTVIINFWATWCPPCRTEIPSMQRAWKILQKRDVVMLAVHVGGDKDKIWSFLIDFGVEFPVLLDTKSHVSRSWPLMALPTTFIVDPQGKIVLRAIGGREWDRPSIIKTILAVAKNP